MKTLTSFVVIFLLVTRAFSQDVTEYGFMVYASIFKIDVKQQWTSTGLTINQNEKVVIVVKGIANISNERDVAWVGPDGKSEPLQGSFPQHLNAWSVIGKIGQSGNDFNIGSYISFISNVSGELILGFNDSSYGDNSGLFVAFIYKGTGSTYIGKNYREDKFLPESSILNQNYPNPFNPDTKIEYFVPNKQNVKIRIFNNNGQLVKVLVNEVKLQGSYIVHWDGTDENGSFLSSGTYFYQLEIGNFKQTKKMILIR